MRATRSSFSESGDVAVEEGAPVPCTLLAVWVARWRALDVLVGVGLAEEEEDEDDVGDTVSEGLADAVGARNRAWRRLRRDVRKEIGRSLSVGQRRARRA